MYLTFVYFRHPPHRPDPDTAPGAAGPCHRQPPADEGVAEAPEAEPSSQQQDQATPRATTPTLPRRSRPRPHGRRRWTAEGNAYIQRLPLLYATTSFVRSYLQVHPETVAVLERENRGAPWTKALPNHELKIYTTNKGLQQHY